MSGNRFLLEIHARNRSMMSMEKMLNAYHLLSQTLLLEVPGAVVELGCYRGLTAVLLQKTLDCHGSQKELSVYDSFEGLPDRDQEDLVPSSERMRSCDYQDNKRVGKGWFKASEEELLSLFDEFQTKAPHIHPGWFQDTLPDQLPNVIAFAHIDADLYQSTLDALEAIYARLSPGAVVLLDDYCDPDQHDKLSALPGVKRACDAFFKDKPEKIEVLVSGKNAYQAFFRKEKS